MCKYHYVRFVTNVAGILEIRSWINLAKSAITPREREDLQDWSLVVLLNGFGARPFRAANVRLTAVFGTEFVRQIPSMKRRDNAPAVSPGVP